MKKVNKIIVGIFLGMSLSCLLAFSTVLNYELNNSTAEVNQMRGVYIFTDCKPVKEYEYLGTEKTSFGFGDSQYTGLRDKLIKKAIEKYPKANGVIITFKTGGTDQIDAIRFKD